MEMLLKGNFTIDHWLSLWQVPKMLDRANFLNMMALYLKENTFNTTADSRPTTIKVNLVVATTANSVFL